MLWLRLRLSLSNRRFSRCFISLRSSIMEIKERLHQQFSFQLKMCQPPSRESTGKRWDRGSTWDHLLKTTVIVIQALKTLFLEWLCKSCISLTRILLQRRRVFLSQLILLRLWPLDAQLDRFAVTRANNLMKIILEITIASRFFQRGKYLILRLLGDSNIFKMRISKRRMNHSFQLSTHLSMGQKSWNPQKMSWWIPHSKHWSLSIKKRKLDWLWC